jgi:hypothetical protein
LLAKPVPVHVAQVMKRFIEKIQALLGFLQ